MVSLAEIFRGVWLFVAALVVALVLFSSYTGYGVDRRARQEEQRDGERDDGGGRGAQHGAGTASGLSVPLLRPGALPGVS